MPNFDCYTIEYDIINREWDVFGHGEFPASSVFAGERKRTLIATFPTPIEALAKYPDASVIGEKEFGKIQQKGGG